MLSQRLSEHFVSWCNYEYMLPTRFFALMAERLGVDGGHDEYSRDQLCWRLDKILRDVEGETFTALNQYMAIDPGGVKRYQLAQQLAYVFDQYQIMRPAMLEGWKHGKVSTKNSSELYQVELWKKIAEAIGHLRHRGVFLLDLTRLLAEKKDYSRLLPKRLSIFGVHSLPPVLLNCLQALSAHCDVHLYLLSPCETHWTDQITQRQLLQTEEQEYTPDIHPLLVSLGTQGKDFQKMLLDVPFTGEFKSFADPLDIKNPCLLHYLQHDILKGEKSKPTTPLSNDGSIVVSSAHSAHREMMILKDRILYWLDTEPDLALKDIVVMAPDIQEYSGLIPAIFHDIPNSVADKNPARSNTFIAVFLQFLNLCNSRFGWEEVLDLLEKEEVYPRFEIRENDLQTIRHWVVSSGIRWGLSGDQKKDRGMPGGDECTWRNGLDRLMMGYAVGGNVQVDGIYPYQDIEGGSSAPLGGLYLFCETLEHACKQFFTARTIADWTEILTSYVDQIFVVDGNDSALELHRILADFGQDYGHIQQETHSFEVMLSWLKGTAEEKKSSSGFLRGQLTFCSMLPMRSIPFRKVCLLGLNDTVFPKNDQHPPFDLLGDSVIPGDRSRRSDDRYQFLEAILSARGSLYLSYVGQSIRSNDSLPPSVLVSELVELIQSYAVEDLVDYHPLHGFSSKYFSNASKLFSYNNRLMNVSRAINQSSLSSAPWWQGAIDTDQSDTVSVDELFLFFRNPQKYFVNRLLGVLLSKENSEGDEHEPFALDSLQNYIVDQDLINGTANGFDPNTMRELIQVAGQWPLGMPGKVAFTEKQEEQRYFLEQMLAWEKAGRTDDCYVDTVLDGMRITGRLGNFYADGSFLFRYAKLKGKDLIGAWLHHCLSTVCLEKNQNTKLLMKDGECLIAAGTAEKKDLQILIDLFRNARKSPASLMIEPAFAYAIQAEKTEKSGKGNPAAKAVSTVFDVLDKGMEAEWELLFQGQNLDTLCGVEFLELCEWFYQSVWKRAHVKFI